MCRILENIVYLCGVNNGYPMNYPLLSEYIEAIMSAKDNFEELTNLRPVLGEDGQPVMSSGNFAVVFKMQDMETGKFYALKCFTKEQEGRAEAYYQITDALKNVDSPYLVSLRYLDKELFVDTDQTSETEFPVLLMDWVEGKTLDKYLRENLDDKYALEMFAYRFSQMAQWLISQPFAHGDLKPDNILVREDGTLVLVDYDGMYVPAMEGQKARELGSPDFRHPQRTENDFDEHIDDFPIISILLSLKSISYNSRLLEMYGASDRLLLSLLDYQVPSNSLFLKDVFPSNDDDLNILYSAFLISISTDFNTSYRNLNSIFHPTFCAPSKITITYNHEELNLVFVKGGTFIMGAQSENPSLPNSDIDAKSEEEPVHFVRIRDFWISDSLIPMEMWPKCTKDMYYDTIVEERKRGVHYDYKFGAYGASYEECEKFIRQLSKQTNLQFDIPTEEEWEYAARGGRRSKGFKYAGSDNINEVAQYGIGIDGGLCALKKKTPNELGIYDMSGSLFEWCKGLTDIDDVKSLARDAIRKYCKEKYDDYFPEFKILVRRGGSISCPAERCRITNREFDIMYRDSEFGGSFEKIHLVDEDSSGVYSFKDDYSYQVGLRLVLRNLTPLQEICSTKITKEDFDNVFVDEYGVIYSADRKRLLKGPTEQVERGGHNWTKGILSGKYSVRPGTACICDRAFLNCKDLNAVVFPQSVKRIGTKAFANCIELSTVDLNDGLVNIGDEAFQDCKKLCSIHLPKSLKQVGNNVFYGCMIKVQFSNYES